MSTTMARRTRATSSAAMQDAEPAGEPFHDGGKVRDQSVYVVVLHNEDRHSLRFCSNLLQKVFQCSEAAACTLTWQIHTDGRAIVWSGPRDAAEQKCEEAQRFQRLTADNEFRAPIRDQAADQPPMRTTIEQVAANLAPVHQRRRTDRDHRR